MRVHVSKHLCLRDVVGCIHLSLCVGHGAADLLQLLPQAPVAGEGLQAVRREDLPDGGRPAARSPAAGGARALPCDQQEELALGMGSAALPFDVPLIFRQWEGWCI